LENAPAHGEDDKYNLSPSNTVDVLTDEETCHSEGTEAAQRMDAGELEVLDAEESAVEDKCIVDNEGRGENTAVESNGEAVEASTSKELDSLYHDKTESLSDDKVGHADESSVLPDGEQVTLPMGQGRGGEASGEASTDTDDKETDKEVSVCSNCNRVRDREKVLPDAETGPPIDN
jgi:hypothetical protein